MFITFETFCNSKRSIVHIVFHKDKKQVTLHVCYVCSSVPGNIVHISTMDTMRSQVDTLDMAGKMLEKFLAIDSSFPTLVDVTQIAPQGMFKSTVFVNCLLYWRWTPFHCIFSNSFVATKSYQYFDGLLLTAPPSAG